MLRLQVLSDLHLDEAAPVDPLATARPGRRKAPTQPFRIPKTTADIVVVAGDWAHSWDRRTRDAIKGITVPLITVLGNHDWYALDISADADMWKREITKDKHDVVLLNPGIYDVNDVRFIGCTWWASLGWSEPCAGSGERLTHAELLDGVGRAINDFSWIGNDRGMMFTPADAVAIHRKETAFLRSEIAKGRDEGKRIVVVTHFSPSRRGIPARFAGSLLNPYFHNDCDALTAGVALWIHGHTHVPCDYVVPETGCRVLCNPRGYGAGHENAAFRADLVVEV